MSCRAVWAEPKPRCVCCGRLSFGWLVLRRVARVLSSLLFQIATKGKSCPQERVSCGHPPVIGVKAVSERTVPPLRPVFGCCCSCSCSYSFSAFHVIGQDLVPHPGDGVDFDPELRSERGAFVVDSVSTSARKCDCGCALVAAGSRVAFRIAFGFSLSGIVVSLYWSFEHGLAAARTGILDAQPLLDARLVKDVALAAIPASRNHRVFGPKILETDGATVVGTGKGGGLCCCCCCCFCCVAAILLLSTTTTAASTRDACFCFGIFYVSLQEGSLDASIQGRRMLSLLLVRAADRRRIDGSVDSGLRQEDQDGALDDHHQRQVGSDCRRQNARAGMEDARTGLDPFGRVRQRRRGRVVLQIDGHEYNDSGKECRVEEPAD